MKASSGIRLEKFEPQRHSPLVKRLTEILHEAYAPLAARGLRYLATHQPASKTLERLNKGESYLLFSGVDLIGTVTLRPEQPADICEYYREPGVFSFSQFAVLPSFQGRGLGTLMMDKIERRAREMGARELALDTAESAEDLIQMYEMRGFRHVAKTQWPDVNYRSVILSKPLQ